VMTAGIAIMAAAANIIDFSPFIVPKLIGY
jgi:hypothetical protein